MFLLTVTLTLECIISGGIIGEGELCCVLGRARGSRGKLLMTKGDSESQTESFKTKEDLQKGPVVGPEDNPQACVCAVR